MEGNAGRVGWGEPREGVEGTERTRSGRRGPQAPQRLVIQNPHFSTTKAPDSTQGVLPQNWGGTELNHTVICMVLKATANDRRTSCPLP
ncbi:hypothetical protein TNCV_2658771 [Trichonephila clavipes]|nr:hypothetical protein TNCV_2658771 [Trichonephila clavipes]